VWLYEALRKGILNAHGSSTAVHAAAAPDAEHDLVQSINWQNSHAAVQRVAPAAAAAVGVAARRGKLK